MKIDRSIRKWIARLFPGKFPALYSTLDNPMEVPVQVAAYKLAAEKYVKPGCRVLDVGFGLGYGLRILSDKSSQLTGIDVDHRVVKIGQRLKAEIMGIDELLDYDGKLIPYPDSSFELVTCIDVLEHVPDYMGLLMEMLRVSRQWVLVSTPNRRPEYTRPNGKPANPWHLREWSYPELAAIVDSLPGVEVTWHFIDGAWEGPFQISGVLTSETMALAPAIYKVDGNDG